MKKTLNILIFPIFFVIFIVLIPFKTIMYAIKGIYNGFADEFNVPTEEELKDVEARI